MRLWKLIAMGAAIAGLAGCEVTDLEEKDTPLTTQEARQLERITTAVNYSLIALSDYALVMPNLRVTLPADLQSKMQTCDGEKKKTERLETRTREGRNCPMQGKLEIAIGERDSVNVDLTVDRSMQQRFGLKSLRIVNGTRVYSRRAMYSDFTTTLVTDTGQTVVINSSFAGDDGEYTYSVDIQIGDKTIKASRSGLAKGTIKNKVYDAVDFDRMVPMLR